MIKKKQSKSTYPLTLDANEKVQGTIFMQKNCAKFKDLPKIAKFKILYKKVQARN